MTVESTSTLWTSIARLEGPDRVTGRARFTADVDLPSALWAKSVFSPLPLARIRSIDPAAALAVPVVHLVLTASGSPSSRATTGPLPLP